MKKLLILIAIPPFLLAGYFFVATKERRRSDEGVLQSYQPSAQIAQIAKKTALTKKGKATLYRADPEFVDGNKFRKYCLVNKNIELALGCQVGYTPGKGPFSPPKIFLLDISNPAYADHKYPAAVHEMLHVAYSRLSSKEKENLRPLFEQELTRHKDEARLMANIDLLKNSEGDYINELHSVFAVEYDNLSPALEDYYKQYFTDRKAVVQIYQNGALESRMRKMEELTQEAKELNARLVKLKNQLQTYKKAGDVNAYNNLVSRFNGLVKKYNAKAAEASRLFGEIDEFYKLFNPNYQPPQQTK